MPSSLESAKRSLVSLLRELGQRYGVAVTVTRDSNPPEVDRAFRMVARRAHPDKPSGNKEDFQRLSARHDAWADLQKARRPLGRPPQPRRAEAKPALAAGSAAVVQVVLPAATSKEAFRFQSRAVLLVFTVNNSTKNLEYLRTHDFCKKRENVRLLCFRGRPGASMVTETLPAEDEELGTDGQQAAS